MGLDVTLAVLVLLAGLRGWLKGFVRQAIGLGALIGCVYLADPLRDLARPYIQTYFPSIRADLFEKLLWWTSAVVSYVATAGFALWMVKAYRRRSYGDPDLHRSDQGAGFALGVAKGLILASFLASAVVQYEPTYARFAGGTWVEDQIKASQALAWSSQYRPAERLWNSTPVQSFVFRVRSRGFWTEPVKPAELPPVQTADSRPRTLEVPAPPLDPASADFMRDLDNALQREGIRNSR